MNRLPYSFLPQNEAFFFILRISLESIQKELPQMRLKLHLREPLLTTDDIMDTPTEAVQKAVHIATLIFALYKGHFSM